LLWPFIANIMTCFPVVPSCPIICLPSFSRAEAAERFGRSAVPKPRALAATSSDQTPAGNDGSAGREPVTWDRVFILTNAAQADSIRKELPFIPPENVVAEPEKRDTAPACALAVGFARARDQDAICALLPADAVIHNIPVFQRQLAAAAEVAGKSDALITCAIPPSYPSTGFGYLHLGEALDSVPQSYPLR
jgi:mannose-1-phosphate guanylyltransferase